MGKRSTFSRVERDNYETPTSAVRSLLEWLEPRTRFVEPCVGAGKLVDHLIRAGHVRHGAYGWPDDDGRVARYDIEPGVVFIRDQPTAASPRTCTRSSST
jgi:hypothetical protein